MASSWNDFWTIKGPQGGLAGVLARAKQLAAGAAEATVANATETPGNYRPAIVDSVPALVGTIAQLAKGKQFSGDNAAERFINDSQRRAALASQRTNETLGIHDPANTNELALRVFGSLAVPSPKAGAVAKVLEAIPMGSKLVRAATKVAEATPKAIAKTAKVATEVAVPFRQTHIGPAATIGGAMTAGLDVLMDGSVDPTTGKRYEGDVAKLIGVHPHQEAAPIQHQDDIDKLMADTAVETGDLAPDELDQMASQPIAHDDIVRHDEEDKLTKYENAALVVGGVLAGTAFVKYSKGFLKAREAASIAPENLPQFTGKVHRSSRAGLYTKLKAATVQQDEPIRNMADDFLGRTYAKQWGYRADRMTNVSIASRAKHFFQTGITPTVESRSVKLAPLAEAFAKELSPEEQRKVSDALNAASALDDYNNTGVLAALNADKHGNPVTPAQLKLLVQSVKSDPKLSKYFHGVQRSHDDLLKYRVLRGRDTIENYNKLRERRPNYVAMNRDREDDVSFAAQTNRYSANADQGLGAARSLEEGGGVQGTTGVGNPFISLWDDWTNEIRRSDLNDLRADFLVNMDASGALNTQGNKIVHELGGVPKSPEDVHQVRINGKTRYFRVTDPAVNAALHMSPRATVKGLEGLRQMQQSMTTGPLASVFNLFVATKTPIYDAMIANLARPKGVKLGMANRAFLGGYTGAIRYMWDDMRGAMATTMRDSMIRENSWLKTILGDKHLDHFATVLENSYENSIKADMDRLGITSSTMHGSPDASKLASGVEQIAPHFASSIESAARDDLFNSATKGDITPAKALFASSKSAYVSANASRLARVYGSVVEALNNGVRYSAHAANKGTIKNLDKHISDMRRLSADSSQHGGNDAVNKTVGSLMYANLGVQSLYEVGKRAAQEKSTFLLNLASTTASLAAIHYIPMLVDQVALEKHRNKTPQQRALSLTTFEGAELPLDPVTRFMTSTLFPILDHMSGIDKGEPNMHFFDVMENWLGGEQPITDEATRKEIGIGLRDAVEANNPIAPSSSPILNIGAAAFGIDPGMSRVTDETMMERTQQLTGLEDDTKRPDSMVSAHMENMISAIFSTAGRSILQMADDLYRAHGKTGDFTKGMDVALSRWRDTASKSAGLFTPVLFPGYPQIESASDINYQMMRDREDGIKQAIDVLNEDSKLEGITTTYAPKHSRFMPTEEGVAPPPEVDGTELGYIASMASQLENSYLKPHREVLAAQGKQIEGYNAFYTTPIPDRNTKINKINEERKYQRLQLLNQTRDFEQLISHRIGRPFTFKDFEPKDYLNPLAPLK